MPDRCAAAAAAEKVANCKPNSQLKADKNGRTPSIWYLLCTRATVDIFHQLGIVRWFVFSGLSGVIILMRRQKGYFNILLTFLKSIFPALRLEWWTAVYFPFVMIMQLKRAPCFQRLFPVVKLSCLVALHLRFKIVARHTTRQLAARTALRHGCVGDTEDESKRWCVNVLSHQMPSRKSG